MFHSFDKFLCIMLEIMVNDKVRVSGRIRVMDRVRFWFSIRITLGF